MARSSTSDNQSIRNTLLKALAVSEYQGLRPHLEDVDLPFETVIYDLGDPIKHVYFPNSGIISLLAAVGHRSTLEVGMVGREGLAGLALFQGVKTASTRAIVQAEGSAMRMSAAQFMNACRSDGKLRNVLLRYSHSLLTQISQSAVCFRFHPIEMRLARWLLMTNDRVRSNELRMTQDFLSNMLGVRREAVNRAARSLHSSGVIAYSRGHILVTDRKALESAACACYALIRAEERSISANG